MLRAILVVIMLSGFSAAFITKTEARCPAPEEGTFDGYFIALAPTSDPAPPRLDFELRGTGTSPLEGSLSGPDILVLSPAVVIDINGLQLDFSGRPGSPDITPPMTITTPCP